MAREIAERDLNFHLRTLATYVQWHHRSTVAIDVHDQPTVARRQYVPGSKGACAEMVMRTDTGGIATVSMDARVAHEMADMAEMCMNEMAPIVDETGLPDLILRLRWAAGEIEKREKGLTP